MKELAGKNVFLVGGHGFFGKAIWAELLKHGADVFAPTKQQYNARFTHELIGYGCSPESLFGDFYPDYIINAGAFSGGLLFNRQYPSRIYEENLMIKMGVLNLANDLVSPKTLMISTSCSYPDGYDVLTEDLYHMGLCHKSIRSYGMSNRAIDIYGQALNQESGLNVITATVTNLFGPSDSLDPVKTKVVGGLIMKFLKAKRENIPVIEMIGDGSPLRDLLYSKNAAELLVRALVKYDNPNLPLNIGSGREISIRDLALLISSLIGYEGEIKWLGDETGQKRKLLDVTRMNAYLGGPFEYTPFVDALQATIDYYRGDLAP